MTTLFQQLAPTLWSSGSRGHSTTQSNSSPRRMTSAWHQVVAEADDRDLPQRTAATCLAVRRNAEAHRQREIYP